jgi:CheY-like chemotaxis protein
MKTILLVDYDPQSIERVRRLLSRAGHQTAVARNGIAGIHAFERLKPDLTLIEGLLPRKHGFEVCRVLKNTRFGKDLPVVVITSPGSAWKQELRMTGCDALLKKPYSDDALLATVRRFIENGERSDAVAEPLTAVPRAMNTDAKLGNLDRPARPDPPPRPEIPVTFAEEDIMAKLDAILPGGLQEVSSAKTCDSKPLREPKPAQAKEAPRPLLKRKKKTMSRRKRRTGPKGRQSAENADAPRRAAKNGRPIKRSTKKSLASKKRSGSKKRIGVRERTVRASSD